MTDETVTEAGDGVAHDVGETAAPLDVARALEAILFVVDEPQSLVSLASAVGAPVADATSASACQWS